MEYRWSIYGGKAVKQRSFLQGKPMFLGVKNQEREKRNPTAPIIYMEKPSLCLGGKLDEGSLPIRL